ncbi:MAG: TraM recognition domain-containing protein [bacterium]|nr:TraM recognition domain-containing protein [bacterium]
MERSSVEGQKFSSPAEEIAFLRAELSAQERSETREFKPESVSDLPAREVVATYAQKEPVQVLTEDYAFKTPEVAAIVLDLSPEAHDRQMEELLGILEERGVKNALTVAAAMNNPHLEDDFHRFLVQYLQQIRPDQKLGEGPLAMAFKMTLFEVGLPESSVNDDNNASQNKVKTILSLMEQLYAGLQGMPFSVELAVSNEGQEILFYISVPDIKRSLLEKQLVAFFPGARVVETKNDYNIFNAEGITVGSIATLANHPALSLKTYEQFDYDPLNVLINSFSKLNQAGEGAAVQILCRPTQLDYLKLYKGKLTRLEKGEKTKEVLSDASLGRDLVKGVGSFIFASEKKPTDESKKLEKSLDNLVIESVKHKLESPLLEVNIRLLASGSSRPAAETLLGDLESAFGQLENPGSNKLVFERPTGRKLSSLCHYFSFRLFNESELLPLNFKELSTIYHLPSATVQITDNLRTVRAKTAPPPVGLLNIGLKLGENRHQGTTVPIYFAPEDRLRHFYTVGQTGTGKSTLLKNMAIQDINNGEGVCFIDPHGVDILDILAAVPPERFEDVIYFDPAGERPLGLNMLEYNPKYPDQKTFVINELLAIFNKLFDMKTVGGPIFEQYFRNSALLALDSGEPATLLDIARILAEPEYRRAKLAKSTNPIIRQFWLEVAEKAGGEAALQNVVPYITSKFDAFLTNDIMRPILLQRHSAFDFRQLMDNKKILLVNLAKGRLGDINANLIGLILIGKILQAALSRVDAPKDSLPPFYLYIDEFQNITTDSTASILSEARKYKLSLNMAHQFISQIGDDIKDAVFGNVGTIVAFRVGVDDAKYLAPQFIPVFEENDLVNLDNRHAYLRLLVDGRPARPFDLETLPPLPVNNQIIDKLRELSQLKYGRPRAEVEAEISAYYKK